ncbi:Nitrilase/cyanide hydratase and apolipoprotein N-acyltransferase [Melioribacter roseus P3M-2]|uniref:Nitrilase/cyanide hydratase and apolipoprotein N-acyltransferase n=1 Tax=Melioribacter roseus (strain DSM 23840 / JCM 17771 / VKM B-2668 / P3M-2) TaxID=1191523 RepID=I7A345_MELRP|nr:nitrilase-related carbon-nitrogen hydrolase [Melioribacter roseus]AFN75633.1 Nitrilase/cyanide hydratase and apolipoprotein N-acyltransferase [Melioribacter roseus P3M-2]
MKAALVQYSPEWENVDRNIDKIESLISTVKTHADLIIFPEMTLTGFTMKQKEFGEEIDGHSFKYFMDLSNRLKSDVICGIIEKEGTTYYNSSIHFSKGLIAAVYRKIHLFSHAKENNFYTNGKEPVVTKVGGIKAGLSICYDLRFPELYRLLRKAGSEILIDIANWPVDRIEHWRVLLRARAIENQSFVIGVNRTGNDPFYKYNGYSSVYDPMGNLITEAKDEEKVLIADLDIDDVRKTRDTFKFGEDICLI